MQDKVLNIEEMTLRLPGVNEKDAHDIAQDVAQRVAANLPDSFQNRRLDTLDLKLSISPGTSGTEMTKLIAEAILKGLV
ncbi:MAG: hypothetical protein NTV01_05455 [Bacteroidia bacterium]|nr:hypothetical protein [Bacteroidia bacterium]